MSSQELPRRLQLPGGRIVELRLEPDAVPKPKKRTLFRDALAILDGGVVEVWSARQRLSIDELTLAELHALRAVLAACGVVEEQLVTVHCKNCDAELSLRPCAEMPLGPLVDAELDDPELDATLPLDEAHPIPEVRVGAKKATTVRLRGVTVGAARGLFSALSRKSLDVDEAVVRGLGIASLGPERDPKKIAVALAKATDDAFGAIGNLFLRAHYPLRLGAVTTCKECGARNDVDAPYDRELEPWTPRDADESDAEAFPDLAAFDDAARALAKEAMGASFEREIAFVVDGGVPACDDGGEPLLGSYVPGTEGDHGTPSRAPEITVYFRTFKAMWDEDGPYDWRAELEETIEHELEHHVADGRGHDAVDEEERAEIAREAARVLGKKALARNATANLGRDFGEFLRRTWPIWVLALIVVIVTLIAESR